MKPTRGLAAAILILACVATTVAQIPVLAPGTVIRVEDLKGKIVLIRGFSSGPVLRYDSSGTILEAGSPESWTLAAVRLDAVSRHGDVLEMRGSRMALHFSGGGLETVERKLPQGRNKFKPDNVTIIVNLPRPDDAAAVELAQRIFLTDAKQLNDLVPECWRVVVARLNDLNPANVDKPSPKIAPEAVFKVGGGVSAPQPVSIPNPPYVEAARIAQIQGTTVLWVILGHDGSVQDVRIARAIGFGLDDNAVATVKQWQFKPAIKDGQPVSVQISIEVNFRLH